jgi:hypothetical protein
VAVLIISLKLILWSSIISSYNENMAIRKKI